MITDFEAYLLTLMRAKDLVVRTLDLHELMPAECQARARRAADVWGFRKTGYSADVFREAIGPPADERPIDDQRWPKVFAGSTRRLFEMSIWPHVMYCVYQHPSGYAWGEGFVPHLADRRRFQPAIAEPWDWSYESVAAAGTAIRDIEAWDIQRDVEMTIGHQVYQARFDLGLMQMWKKVE